MYAVPTLQIVIPALISAALEMWPDLKKEWDKLTPKEKKIAIFALVAAATLIGKLYTCGTGRGCPTDWLLVIEAALAEFLVGIGVVGGTHNLAKKKVEDAQVEA